MENAVVYARYSSHNQTEQSIEGQLAAAQKYAKDHGYQIIHEYCDRAKTGTNDNREEFQRMLSDCSKKQFTVIIVWKVDRFGRNREEITFNKYRAKKNGVRVEYIAENVVQGPEGVILESVLEGMAEYYSLQLSQNVKRGILETAKKHKAIGGWTPLGYRVNEEGYYEIDPVGSSTVRTIFEKYNDGMSLFDLMRYLNENGHRTIHGELFTKNSLPRILKNERYTGVYIFKDIIHDEGGMPQIISKELFESVQLKLSTNRRRPVSDWNNTEYLLSGKVFCGLCGSQMVGISGYGRHGGKYNYYCCNKRHLNKSCKKEYIRQDCLEETVLKRILNIINNPELLERITEDVWQLYEKENSQNDELERLNNALNASNKARNNLVRSVEQGMPYELVEGRIGALNDEITMYQKQLSEYELTRGFRLTKEHILFFLQQFASAEYTNIIALKKMIKTFVNSVYVYDDHCEIAMNYSDGEYNLELEDIEKGVRIEPLNQGNALSIRINSEKRVLIITLTLDKVKK